MLKGGLLLLCMLVLGCHALYSPSDDVYDLTPDNFQKMVIDSHFVWIVEFYAPWCGHCKALAPEYKKAATALKGIVRLGAVDADEHKGLGGQYGVRGFPTIKVFGSNKGSPTDYKGQRTADAIVQEALSAARSVANARLGKSGSDGGSSERPRRQRPDGGAPPGGRGGGGDKDVIELTDSNFEELVINSEDYWLVEFFAPWCGHCKNLAPEWARAASELKGKFKLGALDATVHTVMANRYQVRGYPTIKYFPGGKKSFDSSEDYTGGRTSSDIVRWASDKVTVKLPPPKMTQVTDQEVFDTCAERQLCIISFLPNILDSMASGRNDYIQTVQSVADQVSQRPFGWVWMEGGQNPDLEKVFDVGGFGYPALVGLNPRRKVFSVLRGAFSESGIMEYLKEMAGGRGRITQLKDGENLPAINTVEAWDGQDGELPVEDDIDLSDFDMDGEDTKDEL